MDLEPAISSAKRPRAKTVRADGAQKPKRKTLTASRKPSSAASAQATTREPQSVMDLEGMIAVTAFYLAAERGFAPGRELDDWLEAERRVRALQSG
jgi:hypothetical protein